MWQNRKTSEVGKEAEFCHLVPSGAVLLNSGCLKLEGFRFTGEGGCTIGFDGGRSRQTLAHFPVM